MLTLFVPRIHVQVWKTMLRRGIVWNSPSTPKLILEALLSLATNCGRFLNCHMTLLQCPHDQGCPLGDGSKKPCHFAQRVQLALCEVCDIPYPNPLLTVLNIAREFGREWAVQVDDFPFEPPNYLPNFPYIVVILYQPPNSSPPTLMPAMSICEPITNFNSRQYFWLYNTCTSQLHFDLTEGWSSEA